MSPSNPAIALARRSLDLFRSQPDERQDEPAQRVAPTPHYIKTSSILQSASMLDLNARQSLDYAARPSFDFARPSFDFARPSFDFARPSFDFARPSFDYAARPSFHSARQSLDMSRPSLDMSRPVYGGRTGSNGSSSKLERLRRSFRTARQKGSKRFNSASSSDLQSAEPSNRRMSMASVRSTGASIYGDCEAYAASVYSFHDAPTLVDHGDGANANGVRSSFDMPSRTRSVSMDIRRPTMVTFTPTARKSSLDFSSMDRMSYGIGNKSTPALLPEEDVMSHASHIAGGSRMSLSLSRPLPMATSSPTCYTKVDLVEKTLDEAVQVLAQLTEHGVKRKDTGKDKSKGKRLSIAALGDLFSQKQGPRRDAPVVKIPRLVFAEARGYCFLPLAKTKSASLATLFCRLDNDTLSSPLFLQVQWPEDLLHRTLTLGKRKLLQTRNSSAIKIDSPTHLLLVFQEARILDLFRKPTCVLQSPLHAVRGPIGVDFPEAAPIYTYAVDQRTATLCEVEVNVRGIVFKQAPATLQSFYHLRDVRPSDVLDAHYHTPVAARALRQGLQRAISGQSQGPVVERVVSAQSSYSSRRSISQRASFDFGSVNGGSSSGPCSPTRSSMKRLSLSNSIRSVVSSGSPRSELPPFLIEDHRSRSNTTSSRESSEIVTPDGSQRSSSPGDMQRSTSQQSFPFPTCSDADSLVLPVLAKPERSIWLKAMHNPSTTLNTSTWISSLRRNSDASQYSIASGLSRVTEASEDGDDINDSEVRQVAAEADLAYGMASIVAQNRQMASQLEKLVSAAIEEQRDFSAPAKPTRSPHRRNTVGGRPQSVGYDAHDPLLRTLNDLTKRRPVSIDGVARMFASSDETRRARRASSYTFF